MGDCNAQSTFQQLMTTIFWEFTRKSMHVYLDDISFFKYTQRTYRENNYGASVIQGITFLWKATNSHNKVSFQLGQKPTMPSYLTQSVVINDIKLKYLYCNELPRIIFVLMYGDDYVINVSSIRPFGIIRIVSRYHSDDNLTGSQACLWFPPRIPITVLHSRLPWCHQLSCNPGFLGLPSYTLSMVGEYIW